MCLGTNVSWHKRVWAQTCLDTNVFGHNCVGTIVWAQVCMGTNVSGHKRVWAQTCLGTNLPGHKRAWVQTCLDTNSGHNRVGSSMCGHKPVVSEKNTWRQYVDLLTLKCMNSFFRDIT